MEDMRYPIGNFDWDQEYTAIKRRAWIEDIEQAPARLRAALDGLSVGQLDTPYRPEGWTLRQVAHHVADSHMNAFVRFKLALTEDEPIIKPYRQDLWARLDDACLAPPDLSLGLLECLHLRWVTLLRGMSEGDFKRTFRHPERGVMTLETTLGIYAWHGRHHAAHITGLRERMRW